MNSDAVTGRAEQLAERAREAAEVRALTARPEVAALHVERVGAQVDALLWAGIGLGLLFTTVNVQRFAAEGAPAFSAVWWAAWLLDPMVSLVLLAVIRAEQVTARHQLRPSTWARVTKWAAFTATYVMNTWGGLGAARRPALRSRCRAALGPAAARTPRCRGRTAASRTTRTNRGSGSR